MLTNIFRQKLGDIALLRNVIYFHGYTGSFPYIKKYKLLFLIPLCFLGIVFYTAMYIPLLHSLTVSLVGLSIFVFFLPTVVSFNLLCLKDAFCEESSWNTFFSSVEIFDTSMEGQRILVEENIFKYYSVFILGNILCASYYVFSNSVRPQLLLAYQEEIASLYYYFVGNQMLVNVLVMNNIFVILEKRYEFLKTKLRDVFLSTSTAGKYWNEDRLKTSYLLLDTMVKTFNKLFGPKIFVIIFLTFLYVPGSLQFVLLEDPQHNFKSSTRIFITTAGMFAGMVSIIYTIIY